MAVEEIIRKVSRVEAGMATSDGAGVNLTRVIGTRQLLELDPFLLLDEFKSENPDDYIGGFPLHPHRGFETITYLLHGNFRHQDSKGNEGYLTSGSVQWMTAGRGIIHSEMPEMADGLVWGYQLWLNLPAEHKMVEPRYQDISPEQIPSVDDEGSQVNIIAGEYRGIQGPAKTWISATYLDVVLDPGSRFQHRISGDLTVFAYIIVGDAKFGSPPDLTDAVAGQLLVFGDGDAVIAASGKEGARLLLLAAQPLREPIVRGGPFVMNTREELVQAFLDYQNGTLDR
jgi:redox-sensitive bicupin YhaK (pirin superfamily)